MKTFHLGDILSVTTERVLSPRGMAGIYELLNYMTDDDLFTHQLPRAATACRPGLLAQYPELGAVCPSEDLSGEGPVRDWLAVMVKIYGEHLDVQPLQIGVWKRRNPLAELAEMVGPERVVPVVIGSEEPSAGGAA